MFLQSELFFGGMAALVIGACAAAGDQALRSTAGEPLVPHATLAADPSRKSPIDSIRSWIPATFLVEQGLYAGRSFPVSAEALIDFTRSGTLRPPLSVWRTGLVPVCVDDSARHEQLGAAVVTAAAEGAINELQRILGRRIFEAVRTCVLPAAADPAIASGVILRFRPHSASRGGRSFAHTNLSRECLIALGFPEGCIVAMITKAEIIIEVAEEPALEEYRAGGVIQHELLHALGLNHTCVAPALLFEEFGAGALAECQARSTTAGYPTPGQTPRPSPYDVVHLLLLNDLGNKSLLRFGRQVTADG